MMEYAQTSSRRSRSRLLGLAALVAAVATAFLAGSGTARAALQDDVFAGLNAMSLAQLDTLRGGISRPAVPFGMKIHLGGRVSTSVNGTEVFQTVFNVDRSGISRTAGVPNLGNLPTNIAGITVLSGNGVQASSRSSGTSGLSVTSDQVTIPNGFEGVVVEGDNGVTAGLTKVDPEGNVISNVVVATDDNMTISQNLSLDIVVSGFSGVQRAARKNAVASRLNRAIRAAALGALAR